MTSRRGAGAGSVYRRRYVDRHGQPQHTAVWWIAYTVKGRRVRESAGTETKREAEALLRQRLAGRDQGHDPFEASRLTLQAVLDLVRADYVANGRRSLARVTLSTRRLTEVIPGETLAREVDEGAITRYCAGRLEAGDRPATVNRDLAMLRRGLRLAARAGRLGRVPFVAMLAERNTRTGFVERAQLEVICSHLPADLAAFVRCAWLTGWRRGELASRQWRHVDLRAGWLRLEPGETKSGEGRMFPLYPELRALLEAQRATVEAAEKRLDRIIPWVFPRLGGVGVAVEDQGGPIRQFGKAWARACAAAGCPGRLVHDLRRSAVRNLERAGVPRSTAMRLVGHRTEAIYRRYAIVDEAMLAEAAEKLGRLR